MSRSARAFLWIATAVWVGVVAGLSVRWWAVLAGVVNLAAVSRRGRPALVLAAAGLVAGAISGTGAALGSEATLTAAVATGHHTFVGRALGDPMPTRFGWVQLFRPDGLSDGPVPVAWRGPGLAVETDHPSPAVMGDRIRVDGRAVARPGWVRGDPVAGRIRDAEVSILSATENPGIGLANALRARILGNVEGAGQGRALLAGFLVGDTSRVDRIELEALRRAGLTHFVAVSGSNVATFLWLWWLVLAPLRVGPRVRAAVGLAGVVVFVLVTRAEPSVVRAGVMVMVVLVGRMLGWAFDKWAALGLAVTGCLLVAGQLATDVGFQLSVAATAGVMYGSGRFSFGPKPASDVLAASLSAQMAVAPIMLVAFGTVPALAPLANLVAAPLVALATAIGGVGALTGLQPLVSIGALLADAVLVVGRVAAPWPQLGVGAVGLLAVVALVAWRAPSVRPVVSVATAVAVAVAIAPPGTRFERPAVVFLDVGQGDAALILADGLTVLIDGGPDPLVLDRKLDRYGVGRIDLLVATHVHADHVEGLRAVVGRRPVGVAWTAFQREWTPSSAWLEQALADDGVATVTPRPGSSILVAGVALEVLGPSRRYENPNDQSIVIAARVAGRSYLFAGDAEVAEQGEIAPRPVDVLKVPHHGGDTSDRQWLVATHPALAVVSVGADNTYGHPDPGVLAALASTGATVLRTDLAGDVVIEPSGLASTDRWWRLAG